MITGIVDHETGTRDMHILSGLRKAMPITAILAIIASAAMAGVPLLNGFISKEMFLAETIELSGELNYIVPILAVVASTFSVAYSYRFVSKVFFGPPAQKLPQTPHDPNKWMLEHPDEVEKKYKFNISKITFMYYPRALRLKYSLSGNIELLKKWNDVIKSVDVFITPPITNVDTNEKINSLEIYPASYYQIDRGAVVEEWSNTDGSITCITTVRFPTISQDAYNNKENWKNLVRHCMECDFSWDVSAKSYEGLYNETANLW